MDKILKNKYLSKIFLFIPLIFYFGKRSYLAYDEGFYALQARWILEKDNWIIPLWWDRYVLDRTIGIQFLIAKSQDIFGINMFSAYLPTTIAAITMLFITFKLHEELFGKKNALISPLILSTTYLWFDYAHLASQDLIYSCLVTIGVFSLVKIKSKDNIFYILLFGIWIGLAFMMKTFLVAIPLLSLTPYLLKDQKIIQSKFFWIGLLIGFIPFLIWTLLINQYLEKNIIFQLFEKLNFLSNKNTFTNPFYYYFLNIPITFLPWSIFSIIGIIYNFSEKNKKYVLTFFPIFLIIILSIFSSKAPYYPLQISSILSLNSYLGIKFLLNSKRYKSLFVFATSKIIPLFIVCLVIIYFIFYKDVTNFSLKENSFLVSALILFALGWSLIKNKATFKRNLVPLIIGPYLLTSLVLQSGLFTDRSREIRETMEYVSSLDEVQNQIINVDISGITDTQSESRIIRIALLTPNLGKGLKSISNLNPTEIVWSADYKVIIQGGDSYKIIYEDKTLEPWKLVLKK